ncbi:hypothetical protein D5086_029048 [Populus alba]|uniref:Uncharacterized protein n=1 Tax=Populus alba TaxID=43335 RepID=A0ACC4ASC9_POPAL
MDAPLAPYMLCMELCTIMQGHQNDILHGNHVVLEFESLLPYSGSQLDKWGFAAKGQDLFLHDIGPTSRPGRKGLGTFCKDPTHPNVSYDESRFTNLWPKTKHLPCVEKGRPID